MKRFLLCALAGFAWASAAHAVTVVNIKQNGSDVLLSVEGSLNTTGITYLGVGSEIASIWPSEAELSTFSSNPGQFYLADGSLKGPSNFGLGSQTTATTSSGDIFVFDAGLQYLILPIGYISGANIVAGATFANFTLASLGLKEGTYIYTLPNDSIRLQIDNLATGVPETASWSMMLAGFGAVGSIARYRRRTATKAVQTLLR